jgi:hypothetical protein
MSDHPTLATSRQDLAAALARGAASGIPLVGGLVAELVNFVIPNQKIDRVVAFVEVLAEQASKAQAKQALLESRLRTSLGSDLLEEGLVQASRAVSDERRRRIARIVFNGVTDNELQYDRIRKLLAILDSLTDSELVLLVYHSRQPTIGSSWHKEMRERHASLLRPTSRETGAPRSEVERGAIRDAYERALVGHGLLVLSMSNLTITPLGRLLLRYAEEPGTEPAEPAA